LGAVLLPRFVGPGVGIEPPADAGIADPPVVPLEERLREACSGTNYNWQIELHNEAADEIKRLRSVIEYAAHQLEKARIWNGAEWHYNPLHPLHYRSALERLRDVLRA
jgi:hypothetical protein